MNTKLPVRIVGTEKLDGGCQYNIEGIDPIAAVITRGGPSIGIQGAVEDFIRARSLFGDAVEAIDCNCETRLNEVAHDPRFISLHCEHLSDGLRRWTITVDIGCSEVDISSTNFDTLLSAWESITEEKEITSN